MSCARLSLGPPLVLHRLKDVAGFLADRKYHLTTYKKCFVGNEFVDWLVANGEVTERQEGVELGRQLLDSGTIRHGQHSVQAVCERATSRVAAATLCCTAPLACQSLLAALWAVMWWCQEERHRHRHSCVAITTRAC